MGEFDLIYRYFARSTRHTLLGPGDDCALVEPSPGTVLAVTTDMLVAGVHFLADTDPRALGWKTLAVNLSDLAAMGAKPRWVLLAGSLPNADEAWIAAFAEGFHACADKFEVDLIGGDTTQGPLNLCVTAFGELVPGKALRRSGAKAGDDIWISGHPGLAALGLRHLQHQLKLPAHWQRLCIQRLQMPLPRVSLGQTLADVAHAAIDVSDGFLADLGHIARASGLEAQVFLNQLPRLPEGVDRAEALECLLAGGDDYELCFTACPSQRLTLGQIAAEQDIPLWRVGTMADPASPETRGKVHLSGPDGEPVEWAVKGYQHFAA